MLFAHPESAVFIGFCWHHNLSMGCHTAPRSRDNARLRASAVVSHDSMEKRCLLLLVCSEVDNNFEVAKYSTAPSPQFTLVVNVVLAVC
jgi:hypothetical protein